MIKKSKSNLLSSRKSLGQSVKYKSTVQQKWFSHVEDRPCVHVSRAVSLTCDKQIAKHICEWFDDFVKDIGS